MSELTVLQAVRLKGRVTATDLAATLGTDPAEVAGTVEQLTAEGLVVGDQVLKLSRDGRARLDKLLTEERENVDTAAIVAAYNTFRAVNADFKAAVTDWQLKDGEPNTHQDAGYDAAVLARIDDAHQRVLPIIAAAASQLPRLKAYSAKLEKALDKVKAGDTTWLTRPLIDSYHTVWFELHEELMGAAGLTREAEAKAANAE
ncbi:MarR family transcriptional regulator [uncultured Mycobacterium sp.]|uniref:MarR family transcriptional regulator n=1 Tax=uncultured Mycobacterium sp. TaxID=171292 RepID=UPI0035CC5607